MPKQAREQLVERIQSEKVFAVLRLKDTRRIKEIIQAIVDGGITIIEITLNSQNALECIHTASREFPNCLIGAGTVIGYDATVTAIENGARFVVSPVTDLEMVAVAKEIGVVSMAGALTPTEAWQAWLAGVDFVKLFPLAGLGPQYIRAIRGPLDMIRYVPTNGVTIENVKEWFDAGASAVGVGSALVNDSDIAKGDLDVVRTRAATITQSIGKK